MRWWPRRRSSPEDPRSDRAPQQFPELSSRALIEDWLRALTIIAETGQTPQQKMDLIAEVNQVRTIKVVIDTPLLPHDAATLRAAQEWTAELHSRQAGVNFLVENLLISWLTEATGQSRGEIIQRLALAIDPLLPPP